MIWKALLALCAAFVLYCLAVQPGPTLLIVGVLVAPYLILVGWLRICRAIGYALEVSCITLRCQFDRTYRETLWTMFTEIERGRRPTLGRRLERRLAELSTRVGHQAPAYFEAPRGSAAFGADGGLHPVGLRGRAGDRVGRGRLSSGLPGDQA